MRSEAWALCVAVTMLACEGRGSRGLQSAHTLRPEVCVALRVVGEPPARAVLVQALTLGSHDHLQLDTGADRSVLYGSPVPTRLELGLFPDRTVTAALRPDLPIEAIAPAGRLVGTVGTDALAGRTLVFDTPAMRLCSVVDPPPTALPSRFAHGKILVSLSMGDTRLEDVAFDTGAQFGLVVDPPDFERLTGRAVTDPHNGHVSVPAWGRRVAVVTAPTRADVTLGGLGLGRLEVATVPAAPDTFARVRRFRLRGLLGWPALAGRVFALTLGPGEGLSQKSPRPCFAGVTSDGILPLP